MSLEWPEFYSALADAFGAFSPDTLFGKIRSLARGNRFFDYFHFDNAALWQKRGTGLDPFSVLASFNRGQTDAHRAEIAGLLAREFEVSEAVPECYHGIPFVDPRRSIFDGDAQMWDLFRACKAGPEAKEFQTAYTQAKEVPGNALGNLSIALFWARAGHYMAVDRISGPEIQQLTGLALPSDKCDGAEYAQFLIELKAKLGGESFPELAFKAWQKAHPGGERA